MQLEGGGGKIQVPQYVEENIIQMCMQAVPIYRTQQFCPKSIQLCRKAITSN
jgi:hypothetical protein